MQRIIELKHVGPKAHVRQLLEDLIGRLEEKLQHVPAEATTLHVMFEENGTHKLYRTSLTCHIPGHTVAAHEERRDAGSSIRKAFAEVERQLEKQKAVLRHEHLRRRSKQTRRPPLLAGCLLGLALVASEARSETGSPHSASAVGPTPQAVEAMQLLDVDDPYQRQLGFLRLEALREPATLDAVRKYLDSKDPEMRAQSLRAIAAIEGAGACPVLLQRLKTDRHPLVRRAALLGLEPFQSVDSTLLPAFLEALADHNPEVRMTAADVVSRIDDPRARQAIRLRLRKEHTRDVRRVLNMAMTRLGS